MHRFQHLYVLFLYAMFSLDYVFARDFEAFFFPTHDYLKRTKHPLREYVILFAGKAFYITYMLILPILVLHKSPLLVIGAFLLVHLVVGLTVSLVFQTTHTIDTTYIPHGPQRVRQRRLPHLRHNSRLRDGQPRRRVGLPAA